MPKGQDQGIPAENCSRKGVLWQLTMLFFQCELVYDVKVCKFSSKVANLSIGKAIFEESSKRPFRGHVKRSGNII